MKKHKSQLEKKLLMLELNSTELSKECMLKLVIFQRSFPKEEKGFPFLVENLLMKVSVFVIMNQVFLECAKEMEYQTRMNANFM